MYNQVRMLLQGQCHHVETFDIHPEIKNVDRSQFRIINDNLGIGSPREKFNRNVEAIKVLKKCEEENRFATPEEQEILSQYVNQIEIRGI